MEELTQRLGYGRWRGQGLIISGEQRWHLLSEMEGTKGDDP